MKATETLQPLLEEALLIEEDEELFGDEEKEFSFPDGVTFTTEMVEFDDPGEWLETYDELEQKVINEIEGVSCDDPEVEDTLDGVGNMVQFIHRINFPDGEVEYSFLQYGEGDIAAYHVSLPDGMSIEFVQKWASELSENEIRASLL